MKREDLRTTKAVPKEQFLNRKWLPWRSRGRILLVLNFGVLSTGYCLTAASPAPQDIRSIVPPQPFYISGGLWWLLVAASCLVSAGLILWQILRPKRKPPVPLLSPRESAEQRLHELEIQMERMDARTFGGAVCDVLRAYIGGEFKLAAERQTSPEFLASITGNRAFSVREHHVLAEFLEVCDLLKFARADATLDRKRHLLSQAREFLENSSRPPQSPPLPGRPDVGNQTAKVGTL